MRYTAVLLLVAISPFAALAQDTFLLKDGQRIVFLGDSNTFAGTYIAYIEAYLLTRFPEKKFELINLGLPSETVSGLSEPDHPYPRPNVHDRLEQALKKTRPDVVIACYGMNDGIYHPYSDARLAKYQEGIRKLIDAVKKSWAKIVLATPAPFDPLPIRKNVRPLGEPKYSWMKPFEDYDAALAEYSRWLMTLRDQGFAVADPHSAMRAFLAEVRKKEPSYVFSGDGIHPNPSGHAIVAARILQALHAPEDVDLAEVDLKMARGVNGKVKDVKVGDDAVHFTWTTKVPMPIDPRWHPRLVSFEKIKERLNRHDLILSRGKHARYALFEGNKKIGEADRNELKIGLDMTRFPDLSTNQASAELLKLVEQRQKLLSLAWLTDVGHMRPDTPKGLPLVEAKRQAEKLTPRIRELAQSREVTLRLVGTGG